MWPINSACRNQSTGLVEQARPGQLQTSPAEGKITAKRTNLGDVMARARPSRLRPIVMAAALVASFPLSANTSVSYGKITAVKTVKVENPSAQAAGALVGGVIGLASGRRGHSGSNKALRAIGGGVAGQQVGKLASSKQAFQYTILWAERRPRLLPTRQACASATALQWNAGLYERATRGGWPMRTEGQATANRCPGGQCLYRREGRSIEGADRRGVRPRRTQDPPALRRLSESTAAGRERCRWTGATTAK